jgi:hypothetical protein
MNRGAPRLETPFLWLAIAVLFGATLVELLRYGPLTAARPATVVSNGDANFYQPFLIFLSRVAQTTPPGTSVSIVAATGRDPWNWQDYMIAIGQLPGRRLIFAGQFVPRGSTGEVPRFAACYGGDFTDPRFRLSRRFTEGNLYERIR